MELGRDERQRGCRHDVDDGAELLGCLPDDLDDLGHGLGRRGQDEEPADDLRHLVQPVGEARRDSHVAAAPADRPEEVRLVVGIDVVDRAVCRDDLGSEDVVDGQAVGAAEEADAAPGRDAADADGAGVPESHGEAVLADGRGDRAGRRPGPGRDGAGLRVDVDGGEPAEVDDQAVLDGAVAGAAVTTAAHGDLEAVLDREDDCGRDVLGPGGGDRDTGCHVEVTGEDRVRVAEAGLAGLVDRAVDGSAQRGGGDGGVGRGHGKHPRSSSGHEVKGFGRPHQYVDRRELFVTRRRETSCRSGRDDRDRARREHAPGDPVREVEWSRNVPRVVGAPARRTARQRRTRWRRFAAGTPCPCGRARAGRARRVAEGTAVVRDQLGHLDGLPEVSVKRARLGK